jgi:hypothetical protein
MAEHVPEGEPSRKLTIAEALLGAVVATVVAAGVVVVSIVSFDANPAWPVIVVVAAIAAGSLGVRRVDSPLLKAAAIGLVLGGVVTLLFWPFFSVD